MSVECCLCRFDISKYFPKVYVWMCPDCKVLYCKSCGKKALKKYKCRYCGKKTLKIKRPTKNPFESEMTSEEKIQKAKAEGIFRLKVIWKGKKDAKKVSFGVKMFSVGTEFGGGEYDEIKLKCGNCKKLDKFRIIDKEKLIFKCVNCNALNQPDKAGEQYFN